MKITNMAYLDVMIHDAKMDWTQEMKSEIEALPMQVTDHHDNYSTLI